MLSVAREVGTIDMDELMQGKGFTQNMPVVINGALDPAILVEAQNSEDYKKFVTECPDSNNFKTKRLLVQRLKYCKHKFVKHYRRLFQSLQQSKQINHHLIHLYSKRAVTLKRQHI